MGQTKRATANLNGNDVSLMLVEQCNFRLFHYMMNMVKGANGREHGTDGTAMFGHCSFLSANGMAAMDGYSSSWAQTQNSMKSMHVRDLDRAHATTNGGVGMGGTWNDAHSKQRADTMVNCEHPNYNLYAMGSPDQHGVDAVMIRLGGILDNWIRACEKESNDRWDAVVLDGCFGC